jgi:hypothetical protein
MKKLILLLLIGFFASCVAKKDSSVFEKDIEKDSVSEVKLITKIDRVIDTVFVENPCDSLGNLKPFKYSLITPQGKVTLSDFKGSISGKIDLKGYEKILETKYKLLYNKKVSEIKKSSVIYRVPFSIYLLIIIETLAIVLLIRLNFS